LIRAARRPGLAECETAASPADGGFARELHRPVHAAAARSVADRFPETWPEEAALARMDERCQACNGTHRLTEVEHDDLVYLVLGHGLTFPTAEDMAWAVEPGDGRC
jgi:hypothetical protein